MKAILIGPLALGVILPTAIHAGSSHAFVIEAIDRGSYRDNGSHLASIKSTLTGTINDGPVLRRGFFVFDLSVLASQPKIASATFTANLFAVSPFRGQQTVSLYDYTGSIDTLRAGASPDDPTGIGTFNDLGSGVSYSSREISFADANTSVSFTFNQSAIADLNASSNGLFAFGVRTSGEGIRNNFLFGNSNVRPTDSDFTLEVTPVPGPLPILGVATAFGFTRKLRKRIKSSNSVVNPPGTL